MLGNASPFYHGDTTGCRTHRFRVYSPEWPDKSGWDDALDAHQCEADLSRQDSSLPYSLRPRSFARTDPPRDLPRVTVCYLEPHDIGAFRLTDR